LKAKTVLVVPGPPREGISHAQARQWFAEALRAALTDAARLGFPLTIPNVGWQPVVYGTSDQILGICEAAGPELRVTYDVGNFLLAGEDNLKALDRVASRLAHVHFKDWEILPATGPGAFPGVDGRPYLGAVLGEGIVDLREPLERLRKLGYKGAISVEYEGTNDPFEAVRRGVAYLRSLLQAKPAPA
jgi:sugar phosphate isomerase/epimerase